MKLKTLLIVVLVLGLASAVVHFTGRPPQPVAPDPRVGESLAPAAVFEQAATVKISENGKTVTLRKTDGNVWRVTEYYDFPADFEKLGRLVGDLTSTKIDRLVSQNPERIKTFEFKDTAVAVQDAAGQDLLTLTLGKNAEGGGRLVRFGTENKAFVARLNAYLDAEPKSWADSTLLTLKPEDIARIELSFPDGNPPFVATRAKKEDSFAAEVSPAGQRAKSDRLQSLLSSVSSLRFSETSDLADANAVAAKANARTLKLTTFDQKTLTLEIGRKPEQKVVKAPEAKKDGTTGPAALGNLTDLQKADDKAGKDGEKAASATGPAKIAEPVTETIPAGPVYVTIANSDSAAEINSQMKKRAFQIYESTFTGLPQNRTELFEPTPTPTPAPVTPPPPAPAK